jgi:uncharacterized protein YbcV (DUF1398 family)
MTKDWKAIARATHEGSESGAVSFPQSIQMLMAAGFDGYLVDLRRATRTYYLSSGETAEFSSPPPSKPVGANFEAETIRQAIKEAQELKPGYTYQGFCAKIAAAGCAGYVVSLLGTRVLYFGRSGETHTEYFPGTKPGARQ